MKLCLRDHQLEECAYSHVLLSLHDVLINSVTILGTFLVVQWLGLHASNEEGLDEILGWDTEIPHASVKCSWNSTQCYVAAWMGGEFGGKWIRVYARLSPLAVHLKLSQHC